MTAYYNEFDPGAAAWLRELIADGQIAPGIVDTRSITDVHPDDLRGFSQCHWFAGVGGWSRALRLAGIPDSTPIWTGSCPCQPFSSAGRGDGFDDPRHLWPHFHRLISACRPARVLGEQVASPAALVWWDAVCDDLEDAGYAQWAADLCSAGTAGAHVRQRLYWVADAECCGDRRETDPTGHAVEKSNGPPDRAGGCGGASGRLADADGAGLGARREGLAAVGHGPATGADRRADPDPGTSPFPALRAPADWLLCRDGKWRPVEPGTSPLVDGLPRGVVPGSRQGLAFDARKTPEARVMHLRGYGNAIDPEVAAIFVRAVTA